MEVKLVVIGGKQAGAEVRIRKPQYLIGRGEECQLRPQSHLISRKHCAILVEQDKVAIEDFSTNGTYVNGERIEKRRALASGDRIKVGGLELEIRWDAVVAEQKKLSPTNTAAATSPPPVAKKPAAKEPVAKEPVAKNSVVKEPATVTVLSKAKIDDDLEISSWLSEDNDEPEDQPHPTDSKADLGHDTTAGQPSDETTTLTPAEKAPPKKPEKPIEKKPAIKIPGQFKKAAKPMAESSRSAAEDMLRQFFPRKKS